MIYLIQNLLIDSYKNQDLISEFISLLGMSQSYWFKRAKSSNQRLEQRSSEIKRPTVREEFSKQDMTIPLDDSLKKQIKLVAQKLLETAGELEDHKKLSQRISSDNTFYDQNISQVMCTLHGSSIILYCINDHRLLCSACVFNGQFHKRHQIMEAAKAQQILEVDLRDSEKILKPKIIDIARERTTWQELLQKLDNSYGKSLQILEKEHDSITASISLSFKKSKEKLEEIFMNTRQSLSLLITSYTAIIKCLKFEHPLLRVKHHYIQQVLDRKGSFENLFPNPKAGSQMVAIFDKFGKNIAKSFKNQFS